MPNHMLRSSQQTSQASIYIYLPKPLLFSTQSRTFCSCTPNRGGCYMLFSHHISLYNLGPVPKNENQICIIQENLTFKYFCIPCICCFFISVIINFPFPTLSFQPTQCTTNCYNIQHQQRCRGTTPALSCQRLPTAGRAHPTLTSSTAPSSPTSATLDMSW